jgi:P-type conjugative transfer protein TrbJ
MRNFSRLSAVVALPVFLMFVSAREARAQFTVSDPIEESETLTIHLEQLLQYTQDLNTAVNTFQHLQLMIREVQQLAQHPSTNIALDLATFSNVVAQSQAISLDLAQMDATFNNLFAPYAPSPLINYAAQYNSWATAALQSIHSAANSAGYQGNMLQNEQQWMQQINLMNQATNGMDQGLQITNVVGLETVAQLQKLRMLMISDLGQQATFNTTILNQQQAGVLAETNMFTDLGTTADQRGW